MNSKKTIFIIHNKPKEADDYEFIVTIKDNYGEYHYLNHFASGYKAEKLAIKFGDRAAVFHNVRIQGCKKKKF